MTNQTMSKPEQDKWLQDHIPHRVRVMLASTKELQKRRPSGQPTWPDQTVERCWTDAVWEGRLSALRWLCEFVGVQDDGTGKAKRPRKWPSDTDIEDLPKGKCVDLPSPEATDLALVWKACTQGSVHPTRNSRHPTIDDAERTRAFDVIKRQLSTTVYVAEPDWIEKWVLQPSK